MEKEFVPYELALRMKQLGFKESGCFGFWNIKGELIPERIHINEYTIGDWNSHPNRISSPTWQQAFRWFREKHEIEATTSCFYSKRLDIPYEERQYHCHIIRDGVTSKGPKYESYEEAELACLEKLIEIVENIK